MRDGSIPRRALLPMLAAPLLGQQHITYRDYSKLLPEHLSHLAAEAVRTRNAALNELTTPEKVRERQRWVRDAFWKITGGRPVPTKPNVRVVGGFETATYKVEKLLYDSPQGLPIPANLYIPKTGKPPYPGVLFQLGHSLQGKAAAPYQKCCQGLVQSGFVVLSFDPMGQGERIYYPKSGDVTQTRLSSADDEHTVPGQQLLLVGSTSTLMQTVDAMASLDVLASHPLVDPTRLASTGNSGGGTITMFLAAVDDRLACAAPSCPNSENFACEDFNPPGSTDDAEQNFPGAGPLGFDRWDTLYPLAPKPLLVLISAKDFFGTYSPSYVKNGRLEYAKLAQVYRTMGKADHLGWWESPLPHGFNYASRLQVYNWFRRWLLQEKPLAAEPPVSPHEEKQLRVTTTGTVAEPSKRPVALARKLAAAPKVERDLREILELEEIAARPRRVKLATVPSEDCEIEAGEISSATHIWCPYWFYKPSKPRGVDEVLIVLDPAGRNGRWGEDNVYHELARRGVAVCAADVRGIGDLTPEAGRGAPRYTAPHLSEDHWAWACVMLGQSLVAQRVTDILHIARAFGPSKIKVAAWRKLTVPALLAAALEPRIAEVTLIEGLASFRHVLEAEQYTVPFANFAPGLLRHTDLPEIAARLGRRLAISRPVDAMGKAIAPAEVSKLYPQARVITAGWDATSLSAI
ncbi:MAG: acetylxylan esterase [Bryobacterales bacterium]|nr:acetylxylan esterase [Bryobacterales bacterium]